MLRVTEEESETLRHGHSLRGGVGLCFLTVARCCGGLWNSSLPTEPKWRDLIRSLLIRLNRRSYGTYLTLFLLSIFSRIPSLASQFLSNSWPVIIEHTHIYNNTLLSLFVIAHMSMCLIVTTWDKITCQEIHPWRSLVLPLMPLISCSSLSEGQESGLVRFPQSHKHVLSWVLFRYPSSLSLETRSSAGILVLWLLEPLWPTSHYTHDPCMLETSSGTECYTVCCSLHFGFLQCLHLQEDEEWCNEGWGEGYADLQVKD